MAGKDGHPGADLDSCLHLAGIYCPFVRCLHFSGAGSFEGRDMKEKIAR